MRRLVGAALLLLVAGCGAPKPATPPPPAVPLHLDPACDLAPAAGLAWLVEVRPRAIAAIPDLIPAIGQVLPEERLQGFAASHGGVDLRQTNELCIARYPDAQLAIARVPLDGARIAAAFDERSARAPTRTTLAANPRVVRLTAESEQVLVLGTDAVVHEEGKPGPLRAAEAFAFGRLKRARPALRGAALARAAEVVGSAPFRVFAPGPFSGESEKALGGLLRAATAIAASVTWKGASQLAVRVVLTGAWGDDAKVAAERFAAAANVLSQSAAGRLFGLDRPVRMAEVHVEPDALVLDATIDADRLAKGLRDAVLADVREMMQRP